MFLTIPTFLLPEEQESPSGSSNREKLDAREERDTEWEVPGRGRVPPGSGIWESSGSAGRPREGQLGMSSHGKSEGTRQDPGVFPKPVDALLGLNSHLEFRALRFPAWIPSMPGIPGSFLSSRESQHLNNPGSNISGSELIP